MSWGFTVCSGSRHLRSNYKAVSLQKKYREQSEFHLSGDSGMSPLRHWCLSRDVKARLELAQQSMGTRWGQSVPDKEESPKL